MSSEKNVVLIGMMGVGKSTVGRHLAVALRKDFFDSDKEIERNSGASISWIFDVEGEAGFRKRESEAIANICLGENIVLATGGGAVVREETRRILSDFGYVVFLNGSVELILSRTEHDKSRPLLQRSDRAETISRLLAERTPYYSGLADLTLDVAQLGIEKTVDSIIDFTGR